MYLFFALILVFNKNLLRKLNFFKALSQFFCLHIQHFNIFFNPHYTEAEKYVKNISYVEKNINKAL